MALFKSSRQHYFHLRSSSGVDFAILSHRTGRALRDIAGISSVELEAYLIIDDWATNSYLWTARSKTSGVPAFVNVYGYEEVGSRMSSLGLYLQKPDILDCLTRYDNPQSFRIPKWIRPNLAPEELKEDFTKPNKAEEDISEV